MKFRRFLSAFLAVLLLAGYLPSGAFADDSKLATPQITVKNVLSSGRILITWEAVEDAVSYTVYRSASKTGTFSSIGSTEEEQFTDKTAVFGKTYYYKVRAIAGGSGSSSATSSAVSGTYKLARPEPELSGTADGKVKISWSKIANAKSYSLYRSADGENWSLIKTVTGTSYTNSSVTAGTLYYYRLQAIAAKEQANSAISKVCSITAPLAAPVITAAEDPGSGFPVISWKAVDGAQHYEVFRSPQKDGIFDSLGTTAECSFTDETAETYTSYHYRVTAASPDLGAVSEPSEIKSVLRPPAAPAVFLETNTSGKPVVFWDAPENANSYKVYRAASKTGTYSLVKTLSAQTYTDTSATAGKTYYYKVSAVGENKLVSAFSPIVSGRCTLAQPELKAAGTSDGRIRISWKKISGAKSYDLYRSTDGEEWKHIKTVTGTSYTNASVTAGTLYFYQLQAVASSASANSAMSAPCSITAPLAAPVICVVEDSASDLPVISWNAVEGAQYYEVFRSTQKSGAYDVLGTTDALSFTDETAEPHTSYHYRVTAVSTDLGAVSEPSEIKSVLRPPAVPAPYAENSTSGKPVIRWDPLENATSYKVYRATSKSGQYKLVKTTSEEKYTDTAATSGKTYYYKVTAIGETSKLVSGFSPVISGTCILAKPAMTASHDTATGAIKLSWKAVSGAVSYDLYRSTDQENWKLIRTVTGTSYTNTTVTPGVTYFYQLQALASKTAANSLRSDTVSRTAKLEQPTVTLENSSKTGNIRISWTASKGAQGYEVYRATSRSGEYTFLDTTDSTSMYDSSCTTGKTYYYKVRAMGETSASHSAMSAIQPITYYDLTQQMSVSGKTNGNGKPYLKWNKVKYAEKYRIYRSLLPDSGFTLVATTKELSYTNTSALDGVSYYYQVKALDSNGYLAKISNTVSISCPLDKSENPKTCYVNTPNLWLYDAPTVDSDCFAIRYMDKLKLGQDVASNSEAIWYRAYYEDDLYYVRIERNANVLTGQKRDFRYRGNTDLQQKILDLAVEISEEWDTTYVSGLAGEIANEKGEHGFNCSGLVKYVFNTVMQKEVPTYYLEARLQTLISLDGIYNLGYPGEFRAQDVAYRDLQPGDVLFFTSQADGSDSNVVGHCGIYLGNNEFVHSTSAWEDAVCIIPLSGNFKENLVAIRRYLPSQVTPANTQVQLAGSGCHNLYAACSRDSSVVASVEAGCRVTLLFTDSGSWAWIRTESGEAGFIPTDAFA